MRTQWFAGGPLGVFTSVFSAALGGDDGTGPNTVCDVFSGPFGKSGSQVRLTFQGGATNPFSITEIWMGHAAAAGNSYDFDGTQVQVKVAGATSFVVPAVGLVVADASNYNFVSSKKFIAAFFASSGGCGVNSALAAGICTRFFAAGNTVSVTAKAAGFATNANTVDLVSKIEVFG